MFRLSRWKQLGVGRAEKLGTIKLSVKKFWRLKEILKSKIPIEIKKKTPNACIFPCLTYGCLNWIYKFTKNRINACQRAMKLSIMNIKRIDRKETLNYD